MLKDTPTEALAKTYCVYDQFAKIQRDESLKLQNLVLEGAQKGLSTSDLSDTQKSTDEAKADMEQCYDQVSKIEVALKNRHAPIPSSCDK